ncbi:MAG: helicase-related protein [Thermoplasmata archaeon]
MDAEILKKHAEFRAKCDSYHIDALFNYDPSKIFTVSKIDPLPFQLEDFLAMLDDLGSREKLRVLISYETGLGKTILAGLVIRELVLLEKKEKNRDTRVLILVPPMAIDQWRKELESKFNLKFDKYSTFEDFHKDLLIASMDTLKTTKNYNYISQRDIRWDLVIVDEIHRATAPNADGTQGNQRYRLIDLLSDHTTHFIGLTATPHEGRTERFVARLRLINKNVNLNNYKNFLKNHNFRRLKKDVLDINGYRLFDKNVLPIKLPEINVSEEKIRFYNNVEAYIKEIYTLSSGNPRYGLLATVITRMISSSIPAGLKSLKRRRDRLIRNQIDNLDDEKYEEIVNKLKDYELGYFDEIGGEYQDIVDNIIDSVPRIKDEIETLNKLIDVAEKLVDQKDEKLEEIKEKIKEHVSKGDKVIVITSFVITADYLYDTLKKDPSFEGKVYLITGKVNVEDRRSRLQLFLEKGLLLIGTDILGESLNLQEANVLINYEMPWSPIVFIQRVGRVYRYPMKKDVFIYNIFNNYKIDQRVLEVMYNKIDSMIRDFDEGSIEIIGHEVTEEEIKNIILKGYLEGFPEAEKRLEAKIENAGENIKHLKEVIEITEAGSRYINAKDLIKDPTRIITEDDLKNLLNFAKECGIVEADIEEGNIYARCNNIQLEKLDVEDKCIKCIIQKGMYLKPLPVVYEYEYTSPAWVVLVQYYIINENNEKEVLWKNVMILTNREIIPYEKIKSYNFLGIYKSDFPTFPEKLNFDLNEKLKDTISMIKDIRETGIARKIKLIDEEKQYMDSIAQEFLANEVEKLKMKMGVKINAEILKVLAEVYLQSKIDSEYDMELLKNKHKVEIAAMEVVKEYEEKNGFKVKDVHDENLGYDLESEKNNIKKNIEVKGISHYDETITLTENEFKASNYFKNNYYLYVVIDPFNKKIIKIKNPPFSIKDQINIIQYLVDISK